MSDVARDVPRRRVAISGAHANPYTGAAVVHREIALRLGEHLPEVDVVDDFRLGEPLWRRIVGTPESAGSDVCITTSTPTPLRTPTCLLPIVYDVRWQWTRQRAGRLYRRTDLLTTSRRAGIVLTISETVRQQLLTMGVDPPRGIRVLSLGPGQMQGADTAGISDRAPSVALVGAAAHKRNEAAAALLASIPDVRATYEVVAISVSDRTKQILRDSFPPDRLRLLDGLDRDQLAATLRTVRAYLALTVSEGFGFPYVEAAYMGCDVIAVGQPLTTEVLGDDAVLLADAEPTAAALGRALQAWDPERVQRLHEQARRRDWGHTAAQLAGLVAECSV